MRRLFTILLTLILLCGSVNADGLLPTLGDVYGVEVPTIRRILMRDPDTTTATANGGSVLTFSQVTEEEFDKISVYLSEAGCGLVSYSVNDTSMQAIIEKEGHNFEFSYDYALQKATLNYPKDIIEEKFDIAAAIAEEEANYPRVGSYVIFGHYPQTESGEDNTPIEWLVLAQDGQKAMLISRYALDAQQYNSSEVDITWQKSTMRSWLNETFLNKAFTSSEQQKILMTIVDNSNSQGYSGLDTNGGNNTQDKVFLLSYQEVQQNFADENACMCAPTEYAIKQGALISDTYKVGENETGYWWLRSPGNGQNAAIDIGPSGRGFSGTVNATGAAVRPALWVDISAMVVSCAQAKTSESMATSTSAKVQVNTALPVVTAVPTQSIVRTIAPAATSTPAPNASNTRAEYKVGQYITFGHYPQTAAGNDNTPIVWLVLAVDGEKALLISRYALDCHPYNNEFAKMTWQKSSLRSWLNETFIQKAFTSSEQKGIMVSNVDNSKSQGYSEYRSDGGNNTQDKVFLLSYTEAWKYFKDDNARMCVPTEYAVKQGAWTSSVNKVEGKATCNWWLRSPGDYQFNATIVYYDGSRWSFDMLVHDDYIAVRPALWVNLESGIF